MVSKGNKILFCSAVIIIAVVLAMNFVAKKSPAFKFPHFLNTQSTEDIDPNILIKAPIATSTQTTAMVPPQPKPLISAEAYIVANLDTGEIYLEHNPTVVHPIASLSKLATALVVLHHMDMNQKITITQPMLDAYGDAGHLVLGETLTVSELLYPLLLESSNDAAEAYAQSYGYPAFISEMNSFVKNLGMNSTSYEDASGLSPHNISNAHDLFILAQYLYRNERSLLDITRQTQVSLASTTEHGPHTFVTINPFPYDPHFIGGKTGRTDEAKESMISMFQYNSNGKTYSIAVIVLRSDFSSREIDSSVLFEKSIDKIKTQ